MRCVTSLADILSKLNRPESWFSGPHIAWCAFGARGRTSCPEADVASFRLESDIPLSGHLDPDRRVIAGARPPAHITVDAAVHQPRQKRLRDQQVIEAQAGVALRVTRPTRDSSEVLLLIGSQRSING